VPAMGTPCADLCQRRRIVHEEDESRQPFLSKAGRTVAGPARFSA